MLPGFGVVLGLQTVLTLVGPGELSQLYGLGLPVPDFAVAAGLVHWCGDPILKPKFNFVV